MFIVPIYLLLILTNIPARADDTVITADFKIVSSLKDVLPLSLSEIDMLDHSSKKDIECIAWNLYFEARGGTKSEQIAVAYVPINRTKYNKFSKDICTNVFQYNYVNGKKSFQFVWASYTIHKNWKIEHDAWIKMQEIAVAVYHRHIQDTANGSIYFSHKSADWAPSVRKIPLGSHLFWKM
jgi:spore germination cell wall hydrolase CwlJ-like protein